MTHDKTASDERQQAKHTSSEGWPIAPLSAWDYARKPNGQNDFLRAAARFYLLAKPFWTATAHAPGVADYDAPQQPEEEEEGSDNAASATSHSSSSSSAAASLNARHDAEPPPSAPGSPSMNPGPHFRHTRLNSPDLIPRAPATPNSASAASAALHSSFSSSPRSPSHSRSFPSSLRRAYARSYYRLYKFFHSSPRRIAWTWSAVMVLLLCVCTYLHALMSYCHRNMSTFLGARDADAFYATLWSYLALTLLAAPLMSVIQYAKNQLSMHWRIFLTNRLLEQYFSHRNYYYLQAANSVGVGAAPAPASGKEDKHANGAAAGGGEKKQSSKRGSSSSSSSSRKGRRSVDNPDQRLADDVRAFTRSSLTFVNELLDELCQVLVFSSILWVISPALVCGLLAYAAAGTYLATAVFGVRLIATNSKQSKLEADFRYSLVRVRTNAEAIAFYSGEHAELRYILWRFGLLVRNLSRMSGLQCSLALFKHGLSFLTLLIPPFVLSPLYFRGEVELGVISQASMAFRQIFNSLNMVVSKMNELSKWRSGMERIWQLEEALREQENIARAISRARRQSMAHERALRVEKEEQQRVAWSDADGPFLVAQPSDLAPSSTASASATSSGSSTIQVRPSRHLHLDHVMVCVAGDSVDQAEAASGAGNVALRNGERVLVRNLSLFLPSLQIESALDLARAWPTHSQGRGLLIMGRSGIGKSTLLRAIAGLWKNGSGTIYRPDLSSLLFLPQRPYMILGTLRQQLLYPFCPQTDAKTAARSRTGAGAGAAGESIAATPQQHSGAAELPPGLASTSYGLRRRWPQSSSSSTASGSPSPSPSPPLSPLGSPSPPPPSSSALLGSLSGSAEELGVPSDEDLEHILRLVNLSHLTRAYAGARGSAEGAPGRHTASSGLSSAPPASGLDVVADWSEVLSLGESQRIAFARILIHQPSFCFCDEITAALDAHNEEKLYAALSTYAPRTVLVSVGHRPALLKHHSHVLHIQEGGRWEMMQISEENKAAIEHITAVTTTT